MDSVKGFRCTLCFTFSGSYKLDRHIKQVCMKGQPDEVINAIGSSMKKAQTEFRKYASDNIFINPNDIKDRNYCQYEVLDILERYGHCVIPVGTENLKEIKLQPHRIEYDVEDWRLSHQGRKSAETEATTSATASTSNSSNNGVVDNIRDDDASNFKSHPGVSRNLFAKKQSNQASAAGNCGRRGRTLSAPKSFQSPKTRPQLPLEPTFLKDGDAINIVDLPNTAPKRRHTSQKTGGNDERNSSSSEDGIRRPTQKKIARQSNEDRQQEEEDTESAYLASLRRRKMARNQEIRSDVDSDSDDNSPSNEGIDVSDDEYADQHSGAGSSPEYHVQDSDDQDGHDHQCDVQNADDDMDKDSIDELDNPTRYKTGLKGKLEQSGFYAVPREYLNDVIWEQFRVWYQIQQKPSNVESNYVANVQRFTYLLHARPKFDTSQITCTAYRNANQKLKEWGMNAKTLANYCKSMKHFISFLQNDSTVNLRVKNKGEYKRMKTLKTELGNILKGLDKEIRKLNKDARSKKDMPSNPNVVTSVIREGKPKFVSHLKMAETRNLSMGEIAFVNSYIAAYICLFQAHRPGAPQSMTYDEYTSALKHGPVVIDGQEVTCINVASHKTDQQYDAVVCLDEEWLDYFNRYVEFVRRSIIRRTDSTEKNFLLQASGKPYSRAGQGIGRLQEKFGFKKKFSASDARKSVETYLGGQDDKVRDNVTHFLCHSKKVRDEHYTRNPMRPKVQALFTLKALQQKYDGSDSNELIYTPIQSNQPSAASTSTAASTSSAAEAATAPKQKPSSTPTKAAVTPTKKSSPQKKTSTPATPNTLLREKARYIWAYAVKEANGDEHLATVYAPNEVYSFCKSNNIPCKQEQSLKINRRLRDFQHKARCNYNAERILRSLAKRMKIPLLQVTTDSIGKYQFKNDDLIFRTETNKIQLRGTTVRSCMSEILLLAQSENPIFNDDQLLLRVRLQRWSKVSKDDIPGKGTGVTATADIRKGEEIFDYHGEHISAVEGDARMKCPDANLTNYMLFYTSANNQKRAIDASERCNCHTEEDFQRSYGRFVNHSRKHPNVKLYVRSVKGKEVVMFIAIRDIPRGDELLFDYGVRRGEDGEVIPFLNK